MGRVLWFYYRDILDPGVFVCFLTLAPVENAGCGYKSHKSRLFCISTSLCESLLSWSTDSALGSRECTVRYKIEHQNKIKAPFCFSVLLLAASDRGNTDYSQMSLLTQKPTPWLFFLQGICSINPLFLFLIPFPPNFQIFAFPLFSFSFSQSVFLVPGPQTHINSRVCAKFSLLTISSSISGMSNMCPNTPTEESSLAHFPSFFHFSFPFLSFPFLSSSFLCFGWHEYDTPGLS